MADGKDDVTIKFGVDKKVDAELDAVAQRYMSATQRMQSATREHAANVQGAVQSMKGSFGTLGDSIGGIMTKFAAIGAILAGGAIFKESVETAKHLTVEAVGLGRQLGITATEASVLAVALNDIHSDTETYSGSVQMLTRQVKSNEDGLKKMGVATRGSKGELLGMDQIMTNALTALKGYKEGADRNLAAMTMFGRGAASVTPLLKLNAQVMEEARAKAEALGLAIGERSVEQTKQYRAAMNDVDDVITGVKKAIGEALMPALTALGEWFSSIGPGLVAVFRYSMAGLMSLFWGLKMVVEIVWNILAAVIERATIRIGSFSEALGKLVHGDVQGAVQAWQEGNRQMGESWDARMNNIYDAAKKNQERIYALFTKDTATKKEGDGGKTFSDNTPKESRVPAWKSELEQGYELRGEYFKKDLAAELEFWQKRKMMAKGNAKELTAVEHEIYAVKKEIAKAGYAEQLASIQEEITREKKDLGRKQELAEQMRDLVVKTHGEESPEARKATAELWNIWQERVELKRKLELEEANAARQHGQATLAIERENLDFSEKMGVISTADRLAQERQLIQQDYQLRRAEIKKQLSFTGALTIEEKQKLNDALAALDDEKTLKLTKNQNDMALDMKRSWDDIFGSIESAFANSAKGIALGTTTWRNAMKNAGTSILGEFTNLGTKLVFSWVKTQLGLTGATALGTGQRLAIESWAAIKSVAIAAWAAIKKIATYAWEAAAGAYQAIVAIPFVGPFLAPVAAGVALAGVFALGSHIASASGGYDVPSDQIAQIHKREMVLPAPLADRVRGMTEPGGGGGTVNFTVNAMDSKDVRKFFDAHGHTLADALKKQVRDFRA